MTARDTSAFLRRLNDTCAQALADAAGLCETRAHRNIEPEHWLLTLLERGESDVRLILRRYDVDIDAIGNGLLSTIDRLPHDGRGKPGLSSRLGQWLEAAWVIASLAANGAHPVIRSAHLLAALAQDHRLLRAPDAWALLTVSATQIERLLPELDGLSAEAPVSAAACISPPVAPLGEHGHRPDAAAVSDPTGLPIPPRTGGAASADVLARFTTDLTQKAREGHIDPVFGREIDIRQMIDILMRRRKNNPILVGDPGVGKTALVEGLALKIVQADVPLALREVRILALDLGLLQAGAGVKGDFEQRLKHVIDAVQAAPTPILLFIDEAHTLIGAGNAAGGADAANLLKPALARGELRTIAATTWSEYTRYIERDAALERRFQRIHVSEPDDAAACEMLRGLKGRYARHHDVHITDAAVIAAVHLSRRYLTGRQLPDKAVDLLDTAAARVRMSREATPAALAMCQARLAALAVERQALTDDGATVGVPAADRLVAVDAQRQACIDARERLDHAWQNQRAAVTEWHLLRTDWAQATDEVARHALADDIAQVHASFTTEADEPLVYAQVDEAVIARVIADWTGVPVGNLLADEREALLRLETRLAQTVVGQDAALSVLGERLRAAKAGLTAEQAPLGVFLLVGPSGVGKTETARALADLMFGGEQGLITINLSEYQEAHTVSQLKGSPPGYVGYGEGGVLTEAVRQRPYSVILLDEVEKAHHDVLTLFYQVFDRGVMRDGEGRMIDFRNTVIVMTSNLGSETIITATETLRTTGDDITPAALLRVIRPVLVEHFQPALLARFQTVVYQPLSTQALARIVQMKLDTLARRMAKRFALVLHSDDALVAALVEACQHPDAGARHIDRLLDQQILPALSRELIVRSGSSDGLTAIDLGYNDADGVTIAFVAAADALA